jgi:hypothetical protein
MAIARRSLQGKSGTTIRTKKGTAVAPESSPSNTVSFGVTDNAGNSGVFLGAPGAGKAWVITSLFVSMSSVPGAGCRVTVGGTLNAISFLPAGGTGTVSPQQLISSPSQMGTNASVGYTSASTGSGGVLFSIAGTAYVATISGATTPDTGQVIAIPIDSDPSTDLG